MTESPSKLAKYVITTDVLRFFERTGETLPSLMFVVAPEVERLIVQGIILGVIKHPMEQFLLKKDFSLKANAYLHSITDPFLIGSLAGIVRSGMKRQLELLKEGKMESHKLV